MLDLDSPRWSELTHGYGSGLELPDILRRVETELSAEMHPDDEEPARGLESAWFELVSAICPMGEVTPASFAVVPHIVALAARFEIEVRAQLLQVVARVEAGRHRPGAPSVPDDLAPAYRASLTRIPHLIAARVGAAWDPTTAQALAGVLLVAKGHPQLGMAVMELSEEVHCPHCESVFPSPGWDCSAEEGEW